MKHFLKSLLIATVISASIAPIANAEILIAPTRVVLENGERSTELVLVNKGTESAAYRVSVENRRMKSDGSMEAADNAMPDERFAKDFVRFTPRRVILEPGAKQTIRISVQTAGLEPGEYRSHLRLQSAPLSAGKTLESMSQTTSDGISIQLIAIRSITIPIIARVGKLDASVTIENASLNTDYAPEEALLVVRMNRMGDRSAYGDVKVFTHDQDAPIFTARGIAIYTPNTHRDVKLALPNDVRDAVQSKTVRITYVSSDPQNPETYADIRTALN